MLMDSSRVKRYLKRNGIPVKVVHTIKIKVSTFIIYLLLVAALCLYIGHNIGHKAGIKYDEKFDNVLDTAGQAALANCEGDILFAFGNMPVSGEYWFPTTVLYESDIISSFGSLSK